MILKEENAEKGRSNTFFANRVASISVENYFALVNSDKTPIHSWSVMWGIPPKISAYNWLPCRCRNLCKPSSVILSDESKSSETKFSAVLPFSDQAFSTESLKPLIWPADKKRSVGILVSISIRHSVDKSVAVMSNSFNAHFSHSTCITKSDFRPINQRDKNKNTSKFGITCSRTMVNFSYWFRSSKGTSAVSSG